jgi:RHS repeat-associated protein
MGTLVNSGVAFYVYDEADHLLGEYDVNGSPLYEVIWLGDLPLGVIKQTKTGNLVSTRIDDIYTDHLNAPRVITRGSDQAILWRWESTEPFGSTPANDNPSALSTYPFNLRFPGQVFDKETGLFQNHHRDYDPYVGRYIQSDPIGLQGGINTYGYVGGNPISYVDPMGLDTYVVSRDLSAIGTSARPMWDPLTHTYTFSTNPDRSIAATYSWGNAANLTGWNLNQPEDIYAAQQALADGYAHKVAPGYLDRYYRQAFDLLNNPANSHRNGVIFNNCKAETVQLNNLAWQLINKAQR